MKLLRRWTVLLLLGVLVAGCGEHSGRTVAINPFMVTPQDVLPPPRPVPERPGPCPYLNADLVERVNDQAVAQVRTGIQRPHPACYFYRPTGGQELSVWVFVGQPPGAESLVNVNIPAGVSEPLKFGRWKGGFYQRNTGSVLALRDAGTVVVLDSNRRQLHQVEPLTKQVIKRLKL